MEFSISVNIYQPHSQQQSIIDGTSMKRIFDQDEYSKVLRRYQHMNYICLFLIFWFYFCNRTSQLQIFCNYRLSSCSAEWYCNVKLACIRDMICEKYIYFIKIVIEIENETIILQIVNFGVSLC